MASRLLRSTDTGAPTLSTTPGSLNNVLKKVLVEGYGATAPLGWTLEFENVASNEIVVRPGAGVRPFFRIMNNGNNAKYERAQIFMYQTMSAYNAGTFCSPNLDSVNRTSLKIRRNNTNSSHVIPWVVIGDNAGFWFLTRYNAVEYTDTNGYYYMWCPHYIGDYIPYNFSNVWNSCLITHDYDTVGTAGSFRIFTGILNSLPNYMIVLRDIHLNAGWTPASIYGCTDAIYSGNGMANYDGSSMSPIAGRMIGTQPLLQTASGIIGVLPGYINPFYKAPATVTIDSVREFYVEDSGIKAFVFSDVYATYAWTDSLRVQKFMILIGEGFRRAI